MADKVQTKAEYGFLDSEMQTDFIEMKYRN